MSEGLSYQHHFTGIPLRFQPGLSLSSVPERIADVIREGAVQDLQQIADPAEEEEAGSEDIQDALAEAVNIYGVKPNVLNSRNFAVERSFRL